MVVGLFSRRRAEKIGIALFFYVIFKVLTLGSVAT